MLNLLQERDARQKAERLQQWRQVRDRLGASLQRHLPGQQVWIFGSLQQPDRFNAASDIDLAIDSLPAGMSIYTLTALLDEDMQRPVDLVYLPESRLRNKIITQGESWIA